jgi:arginyl-tRNA synthetase
VAFQIGKQLRKRPFDVARNIIEGGLVPYFNSRKIGSLSMIESIEPHPSGYINLKINRHLLASMTLNKALSEGDSYGYMDIGKGRHIMLEHTSVNPNKAIHVGHMRNIILGDSLYRLLRAANYDVTVLDYVDDSGLQVADIIVGFYYAGIPLEPKNKSIKFDHYCGDDVYVKVNELYKTNPQLEEKRRLVLKEIEKGDSEIAKFASSISTRVLREQLKTCWRLRSHYDILNFESQVVVSKLWDNLFELLRQKGLIVKEESGKNKGCWVVKIDNEEDKVIVRSDGTATYLTCK